MLNIEVYLTHNKIILKKSSSELTIDLVLSVLTVAPGKLPPCHPVWGDVNVGKIKRYTLPQGDSGFDGDQT